MPSELADLVWSGKMVEVGNIEGEEGKIGFVIQLKSGQFITVSGLTKGQASVASQYLYKQCGITLSEDENA